MTAPSFSNYYTQGPGSVIFEAGFAIATGSGGAYLERCGTNMHEFLTFTTPNVETTPTDGCAALDCPPAADGNEVIWQSAAGRLKGIFLLTGRRFTIRLPSKVDPSAGPGGFANGDQYTLALTPHTLYLVNRENQIWSAPAP